MLEEAIVTICGGRVIDRLQSGCDELGLEDLEEFQEELTAVHAKVNERAHQMLHDDATQAHVTNTIISIR